MRSTVGSRADEDTFWKQKNVTAAFGCWKKVAYLAGSGAFMFVVSLAEGNGAFPYFKGGAGMPQATAV